MEIISVKTVSFITNPQNKKQQQERERGGRMLVAKSSALQLVTIFFIICCFPAPHSVNLKYFKLQIMSICIAREMCAHFAITA